MELNIIQKSTSLDEIKFLAENFLQCELNFIEVEFSIFESFKIYPKTKMMIPKLWTYRIVKDKDTYYFGTLK